jgi:acetaldehyde dehydrogenase (acetylating)
MKKTNVAILGSGNIGTDLLVKIHRSTLLHCSAFIGRNLRSPGMIKAQELGVFVSAEGIDYIKCNPTSCDLVFDATSAQAHVEHSQVFEKLGITAIDLTPAKLGPMCIPSVNLSDCLNEKNVNMVTCGGQASTPIAYAIGKTQTGIHYIEVVSAIASRSAGPATRANLDEYIHTTEEALKKFSGATKTKTILNLNPAIPCIDMQTTVMAKVDNPNIESLKPVLNDIVTRIQTYVPGYQVVVGPLIENGRIIVTIKVKGLGDYLPAYAGNLDIINCAAIAMAEEYARHWAEEGRHPQKGRIV